MLCSLVLAAVLCPAVASGQIYVDKDATGAQDGSSWDDAYHSLQNALDDAQSGDHVWVDNDVYYPDNGSSVTDDDRSASFTLQDDVKIFGGFQGDESSVDERPVDFRTAPTILSGDIDQTSSDPAKDDADVSGNAYHVVESTGDNSGAELRRVRIAHGNADGRGDESIGGGVFLDNTSAKILNSYVQMNDAERGGGIGVKRGTPTLHGNLVNANDAANAGGGVYTWNTGSGITATHNTITHNDASDTGGVFKVNGESWATDGENTSVTALNTNGDKASISVSPTTVSFETTVVGNDLYENGSYAGSGVEPENGVLNALRVTAGAQDASVDMSSGTNSVDLYLSRDVNNVRLSQSDDDFIDTWLMNNTATESAPDLRQSPSEFTTFPDTPDYQSNYDDKSVEDSDPADYNLIPISKSNLVSSYEARVIPKQGPKAPSTYVDGSRDTEWETSDTILDEWQPHIVLQGGRWKERQVDGSTRKEVKTFIESGGSTYESNASTAYSTLRPLAPYPTSTPTTQSSAPSEFNVMHTVEGTAVNDPQYDGDYISDANASFKGNIRNAISESYSALTGGYESTANNEPDDTIFDNDDNFIDEKAAMPWRITWSILPASETDNVWIR